MKNAQGESKLVSCEETPETWFTDYGSGQLVNGTATVNIESEFLSTVNTTVAYHVFIQVEGPCNNAGVYVTNKTTSSFDVVQQNTGNDCNTSFSYRVTAKRKGYEALRMPTPAQSRSATCQYVGAVWPEVLAEAQQKMSDTQNEALSGIPENYTFTPPPPLSDIEPMESRQINLSEITQKILSGDSSPH